MFINEIAIYVIRSPLRTLVAPEHEPLIIVGKPSAYAEWYDFIGAINGSQAIAYMTLTPSDRRKRRINGIRTEVLNESVADTLPPSINQLSIHDVYLKCDKSSVQNKVGTLQAFETGGCQSVVDVRYMPIASVKYISPLDNPIWHSLRERIRSQYPITTANLSSILSETFFLIETRNQECLSKMHSCP